MNQDPFIIIKNYRQKSSYIKQSQTQQPLCRPQRIALKQLVPSYANQRNMNVIVANKKTRFEYKQEDKQNFIWFDQNQKCSNVMSLLPNPTQTKLINYEDYQ